MPNRTRTGDIRILSLTLSQLSYLGSSGLEAIRTDLCQDRLGPLQRSIAFGLISVVRFSMAHLYGPNSCYGMRVGKHRFEFFIEEDTVFIFRMIQRSGDSDCSQIYKQRVRRIEHGCRNCQRSPY